MAECVVGILILKLGSALVLEACRLGTKQLYLEASALGRLFDEIHDIKEELESMQYFLQEQSVITTVWGGVGKTTLVSHVYNTVKVDFDSAAWITVSKAYQMEDLLKQIIRGFQKSDLKGELRVDIIDMGRRSLVEIIRDYLHGKRKMNLEGLLAR